MKFNELPKNKQLAIKVAKDTYNWEIGGYENTLLDYDKNDEEYIEAYKFLRSGTEALTKELTDITFQNLKEHYPNAMFASRKFVSLNIRKWLEKEGY